MFLSLADRDKAAGLEAARTFAQLGFALAATSGTAAFLESDGVPVATVVAKVGETGAADAVDLIASGRRPAGRQHPAGPGPARRRLPHPLGRPGPRVPCLTTVAAARAAAAGIADWRHTGCRSSACRRSTSSSVT